MAFEFGRSVDSFLGNSTKTPIGKKVLSEKMNIGTLVGINANGELVSAETAMTRVVGVITEGSVATIEDARYLPNGKAYKEKGDSQELYREFKLLNVKDCQIGTVANTFKWEKKDIGMDVYLADGKLTTDITTLAVGKKYQRIGFLGDSARREIVVILDSDIITK
jgi:hypothetical protein